MNQYPYTWDDVLSAASRLQGHIRDAVLVGGTAAAIFTGPRVSYDADHVLVDLRAHFDSILKDLESVAGWKTARIKPPVLILGSLDGIETGIRQLIRSEPLETCEVYARGQKITVPTRNEILRIKAALVLKRNATRDYLDFAALACSMGIEKTMEALQEFDRLYPQENQESPLHQLAIQLASPLPFDLEGMDLKTFKNLETKWTCWENVVEQCVVVSGAIFDSLDMEEDWGPQP